MTSIATDDEEHRSVGATVRDRIRTGFDASRVGRTAMRVRERIRGAAAAVETAANRSALASVGSSLERGYEASRLSAAAATLSTWVRNSWLYGWLTAEPEPDVIVIDLRETRTIGPVISVLDRVVPRAASAARESAAWSLSERAYGAVARPMAESRVLRWCVAVLEPPEPPAERGGDPAEEKESDRSGGDGSDRSGGGEGDFFGEDDGDLSGKRREESSDGDDATRSE